MRIIALGAIFCYNVSLCFLIGGSSYQVGSNRIIVLGDRHARACPLDDHHTSALISLLETAQQEDQRPVDFLIEGPFRRIDSSRVKSCQGTILDLETSGQYPRSRIQDIEIRRYAGLTLSLCNTSSSSLALSSTQYVINGLAVDLRQATLNDLFQEYESIVSYLKGRASLFQTNPKLQDHATYYMAKSDRALHALTTLCNKLKLNKYDLIATLTDKAGQTSPSSSLTGDEYTDERHTTAKDGVLAIMRSMTTPLFDLNAYTQLADIDQDRDALVIVGHNHARVISMLLDAHNNSQVVQEYITYENGLKINTLEQLVSR